ncbi:MAG TPA: hypothetical protein VD995_03485 [Azospirillum sp.]|nr:hypothetical protein [Azospirillum sp.]
MMPFATEFPAKAVPNSAAFVAQVVSWLRGTNYSTVLDGASEADLDGEAPIIRAPSGEELRLRVLSQDGREQAIGFRHDFPDTEGRLWRTEMVVRRGTAVNGQDISRLRTQCIAREAGARLDTPRKPYLIKSVLHDGWGGIDRSLAVSDQPTWLSDDDEALALAQAVTAGEASRYLPVIYVSAAGPSRWSIEKNQIEKLAYDLGGVAHVLTEPDRNFSFRLRDATSGRNVYGGAIGISLPDHGIVRRFFLAGRLAAPRELLASLGEIAYAFRSQMPAEGWDWTELQEQALRQHRERERNRLSIGETQALYDEEIANLKDKISELAAQIEQYSLANTTKSDDSLLSDFIINQIGPEIYPGEFMDRLREAVKSRCARADQDGLDKRSKAVLQKFSTLPPSAGLSELLEDLKRSTKDPNRLVSQLTDLLSRHGYQEKARNKHVRLEPQMGFEGLDTITVPTTPSDTRGLTNLRKQIERTLGINKLVD